MTLSEGERRELAAIEQALVASDPVLARAFANPPTSPSPPRARVATTIAAAFVAVAVLMLVGGLIRGDASLLLGGCLVITCMPICVWLVAHTPRSGT